VTEPFLRITGPAGPAEVAAVVAAVLLARDVPAEEPDAGAAPQWSGWSGWSARAAGLRGAVPWSPGPDAWRAANRPGR
jgi:hypothetical protein